MFSVNDKVFDIRYGWGTVTEINKESKTPVKVVFAIGEPVQYTKSGKDYVNDEIGLLRHFPYTLQGLKKVRM